MNNLIIGIWLVNIIISILYGIYHIGKGQRERLWFMLLFIGLPVLGLCLYFIPKAILYFSEKVAYDRESLVKRFEFERSEEIPIVSRELDVIAIEDAIAVSSNQEKRGLLLDQLKKGIDSNYKTILPASADPDSESAHYVATAKMEVYREKYEVLKELQDAQTKNPDDTEIMVRHLNALCAYINSELLMPKEALIYKTQYCHWYERILARDMSKATPLLSTAYITYLVDLGENEKVATYWIKSSKDLKNECGYMKMLGMYYDLADKENFYRCISMLEASDISLSAEGLKIIRYWIVRR